MSLNEKEMVRKMRIRGLGYTAIASALGISENTIKSFCRRNNLGGVRQAPLKKSMDSKTEYCQECGKRLVVVPKQKPRKFCSDVCRRTWWKKNNFSLNRKAIYRFTCICCGKEFKSYGNSNRKYCGHSCFIKDRFKGGEGSDKRAV
jgi:IS30 family transposase